MNLNTEQYVINPVRLEVVELSQANAEAVAIWCGGELDRVKNSFSDSPSASQLYIPSVHGPLSAEIGNIIALDKTTGRFSVMTRDHLEREYQRVGLRQDGAGFPRLRN
jgi:hypothetical protein